MSASDRYFSGSVMHAATVVNVCNIPCVITLSHDPFSKKSNKFVRSVWPWIALTPLKTVHLCSASYSCLKYGNEVFQHTSLITTALWATSMRSCSCWHFLCLHEEKRKKHGFAICHIRFVDNCLRWEYCLLHRVRYQGNSHWAGFVRTRWTM